MTRKRVISMVLVIGMILSFVPAPAYAADTPSLLAATAHPAHDGCSTEPHEVTSFGELQTALGPTSTYTDIVLKADGDTPDANGVVTWTATATLNITGTKHIYVAEGAKIALKRDAGLTAANEPMFSVANGATLILGNGTISYDGTLATVAQTGDYKVAQSGGDLIVDGGAVWVKGDDKYVRGTAFSNTNGTEAVFFDLEEGSPTYGDQFYYNNTAANADPRGIVSQASIINNSGTLDLWPGVTLQNNVKTGDGYGAAIYAPNSEDSGNTVQINMYGGTVKMCASSGNGDDRGRGGAIYLGNTGVDGSAKPATTTATFNMYGGSVTNNSLPRDGFADGVQDGGGISLDQAAMNLYGGSVSYNHAGVYNGPADIWGFTCAGDGGGIMVRCGSKLNMYGGSIDHNYAGGYGGGVVAWNADIYIHGGAIVQNTASFGAGVGIAADDHDSYVYMSGGTVAYNEADKCGTSGGYGGGICAGSAGYSDNAHLILSGGTIQQNKADYGGGVAVYAGNNTYADLSGSFEMTGNFAYYNGNGMYITNTANTNTHSLVRLSGGARIDTNNPVYFNNVSANGRVGQNNVVQIPVQVTGTLTTPGTAAIFEFSDDFWNGNSTGYAHPSTAASATPLAIVNFRNSGGTALDIQENKIALESSTWYLKANPESDNTLGRNTLDLENFAENPQYTIRNGTPEIVDGVEYYKLYSSLADAFEDAENGDKLYIFYNTTITTPAILDGINVSLIAESDSTASIAASSAEGDANAYKTNKIDANGDNIFDPDGEYDYFEMTGNFLLYSNGTTTLEPYNYNIRNDYTVTLSSTLALGGSGKYDNNVTAGTAAIVVRNGASLAIGRVGSTSVGYGSLTFDGNLSYPKEGAMFSVGGGTGGSTLTLYDGVTIMNHSNYSEVHPGAIEVASGGSLEMRSGVTMSGNVSPVAGAVYVAPNGNFTMNGGSISNNYGALPRYGFEDSTDDGKVATYDIAYWGQPKFYHGAGGIYSEGNFTMNGGTIEKNCGEYGGIANMSGSLKLVGGSITGNHAHTGNGEGEAEACDLTITDYTDNAAPTRGTAPASAGSGGGVYIGDASSVTISSVTISNNTAEKDGGGIAVGDSTSLIKTITEYDAVDNAEETVSTTGGTTVTTATVAAKIPDYGTSGNTVIAPNTDLEISVTGSTISNNTAGANGGGAYFAAEGDLRIDASTKLEYNTAYANGGGVAVNGEGIESSYVVSAGGVTTTGAVVSFANDITFNTAYGNGGGVYARGSGAIVTAIGKLTANTAYGNGGGAALGYIVDETNKVPTDIENAKKPAGAMLVLVGAEVNNNTVILDDDTTSRSVGAGVYNDGTLVLTAAGTNAKQPYISSNDVIYLASERLVRLDTYYNIYNSTQTSTHKLTVDSEETDNGTDIFRAADGEKARELFDSKLAAHLNGNLSIEYGTDEGNPTQTVPTGDVELNSIHVTYWTYAPGTETDENNSPVTPVSSEFSEAPDATNVLARSFAVAGSTGLLSSYEIGFNMPGSKLLEYWLLARPTNPTDPMQFSYIGENGQPTTRENAKKVNPGDTLNLQNGDVYLIAKYTTASHYVNYITRNSAGSYVTGTQNGINTDYWGGLKIPGTDYINAQHKYAFAAYTEGTPLVLTPDAVIPTAQHPDNYGVLQEFVVYSEVNANIATEEGGTPPPSTEERIYNVLVNDTNRSHYTYSTTDGQTGQSDVAKRWLKTFSATIDESTGAIIGITAYTYTLAPTTPSEGTDDAVTVNEVKSTTEGTGADAVTYVEFTTAAGETVRATITTTVFGEGDDARAVPSITYNQPSDSILVQTAFKQALVKLEMVHRGSEGVAANTYTAFFDDHNAAFGAMVGHYSGMQPAVANNTHSTVTLLAENRGDLTGNELNIETNTEGEPTKGVVDMGMSAEKPKDSNEKPGYTMNYTLNLNNFTMEMDGVPLLTFANLNATVMNGVIRQSATQWSKNVGTDDKPVLEPDGVPVDTVFDLSEGNFTVENLKILSVSDNPLTEETTKYNIKVGGNGQLHILSGCELGNVYLMEGTETTADAIAYVDASFNTTDPDPVATIYLDGGITGTNTGASWDYPNGEREVFRRSDDVTDVKGSEIRACFKLADATYDPTVTDDESTTDVNEASVDNATKWFIGADGKLHKKVRYVVPELVCGTPHAQGDTCILDGAASVDLTPDRFSAGGYPYFNEYEATYGFEVNSTTGHIPQFDATLYDADLNEMDDLTSGEVRFLVNFYDTTTGINNRLFGFSTTVHDGVARTTYEDMARADVTPDDSPYIISATWYGSGEYASQYAKYWNYNYGKPDDYVIDSGTNQPVIDPETGRPIVETTYGGINGQSLSGVVTLDMNAKPIGDASIDLEAFTPTTAEYVGPAGAEVGYTSAPMLTDLRDTHTGNLLISDIDYTTYYTAIIKSTDYTNQQVIMGDDNKPLALNIYDTNGTTVKETYYYLAHTFTVDGREVTGPIYYTNNGAGAALTEDTSDDHLLGTDLENAKPLNGADVGLYSVEVAAVDGSNYKLTSGWKGAVFEITPYTGRLIVTGPNHIVADGAEDVDDFATDIETAAGAGGMNVTVKDVYGNELAIENYSISFDDIGGTATLEKYEGKDWPASEGLYNVVIRANGHGNGTLVMDGVTGAQNPNYDPDATGYTALLITARYLDMFIIPDEVSVPYTGEIYTGDMVKEYDPADTIKGYQIWKLPIINVPGNPDNNNGKPNIGSISLEVTEDNTLEKIITALGSVEGAERLNPENYRLELGTAYHVPRDADSYTMIATDTSGRYSAIGHLNITDATIKAVEIVGEDSGIYTGQGHTPTIRVTAEFIENGAIVTRVLNENTDYVLTVREVQGAGEDGEFNTADDVLGPVLVSPVNAGRYRYNVRGINNYTGSLRNIDYTVNPKSLTAIEEMNGIEYRVTYEAVTDMFETYAPIVPVISLYYNGMVLDPTADYTLDYAKNESTGASAIQASGTYDIKVVSLEESKGGSGNYTGDFTYPLTIHSAVESGEITLEIPGRHIYEGTTLDEYEWEEEALLYYDGGATLDITRCELLVTTLDGTVVYQREFNGETPNVRVNSIVDAGTYFVTATPSDRYKSSITGYTEGNFGKNTLRIERASVVVKADPDEKIYGENDPSPFEYATDLGVDGFYDHDRNEITGSLSRDSGENVRNTDYHYLLGSLTAGDNYNITVSSETRFHIEPKDISETNVIVDAASTLGYTGYGRSPINSVTYNAPNEVRYSLIEDSHYVATYEQWVCTSETGHINATTGKVELCTPNTTHHTGADWEDCWEPVNFLPYNVGWYRVTLDADRLSGFINNYEGKRTEIYQITPTAGMLIVRVEGTNTVTYSGTAYMPNVTVVSSDGFTLSSSYYTLSYLADYRDESITDVTGSFISNGTEFTHAGTYTINATGISNYSGASGSVTFTILPKNIAENDTENNTLPVTVAIPDTDKTYTYDGNPKQASVTASYDGLEGDTNPELTLEVNKDYTLGHTNHTNVGTATVTVTGIGNYTGTRRFDYTITPRDLTVTITEPSPIEKFYGDLDPTYTYTLTDAGEEVTNVTLTGTAVRAAGETVGTYNFLPIGENGSTLDAGSNNRLTLAEASLKINPKPIGKDDYTPADRISVSMPAYFPTDTAVSEAKNSVVVTYWAATGTIPALTQGTDYTITIFTGDGEEVETTTLGNNSYYAIIAGTGNYAEEIRCDFTVATAGTFLTVTAEPKKPTYAGPDGIPVSLIASDGQSDVTTGTGFTVDYPTDNDDAKPSASTFTATDVGTYVVTATRTTTGTGSDETTTMQGSATVIVHPKNIGELTSTVGIDEQGYTGSGVVLTEAVLESLLKWGTKDGTDYYLELDKDFIVTYKDNVNPTNGEETATVTLHGIGNFTGTKEFKFAIGETRYRVTYHGNDHTAGEPPVDEAFYEENKHAVASSSYTLAKQYEVDGQTFNAIFYGWSADQIEVIVSSAETLTGVEYYLPGHSILITKDLPLYAIWAADNNGDNVPDINEKRYNVFYDQGNAEGEKPNDPNTYLPKTSVYIVDAPESFKLDGYVLIGWNRQEELKLASSTDYLKHVANLIPVGASFIIGDAHETLHPVWGEDTDNTGVPDWQESEDIYYVYYDGNGGTGYSSTDVLNGALSVIADSGAFTRENYIQVGWTTNRVIAGVESAHPATATAAPPRTVGLTTIGGEQRYFVPFGEKYIFTADDHPSQLIIFYALWAEDANGNKIPDYQEGRYTVEYKNPASNGVTSAMPTDNGRYLANLPITLESAPSGTYNGGASTASFLGWTPDENSAKTLYKAGDKLTGVTVYAAGQDVLAPKDVPTTDTTLYFYPLWGEAGYDPIAFLVTVTGEGTYNGQPQTPTVAVADGKANLRPSEGETTYDYFVTYRPLTEGAALDANGKPLNAGTYAVVVTGEGDYDGHSGVGYYTIKPATLTVKPDPAEKTYGEADPESFAYTVYDAQGNDVTASVSIAGALTRHSGEDAGEYDFIIDTLSEASGNYELERDNSVRFVIKRKNIADEDVTVADIADRVATSEAIEPELTIFYETGSGRILTLGKPTDYTVSYSGEALDENNKPVAPGVYTITITGDGNYTGTRSKTFKIAATGLTMEETFVRYYNGQAQEFTADELNVMYNNETRLSIDDYNVTFSVVSEGVVLINNKPVYPGVYTILVTGDKEGAPYGGMTTWGTLIINPAEITEVTTDSTPDPTSGIITMYYNGEAQAPSVDQVLSGEITLNEFDYVVTYETINGVVSGSIPTDVGDYYLVVTGVGNFTGTEKIRFSIIAGNLSAEPVDGSIYNGKPYLPEPVVKIDNIDNPTLNTHYTLKYLDASSKAVTPVDAGSYTVTVEGRGNFAAATPIPPISYAIAPKALDNSDSDKTAGSVAVIVTDAVYTGADITPTVAVTYTVDEKSTLHLVKGTDYTVAITQNGKEVVPKAVGTYTITVTALGKDDGGSGNYSESTTVEFNILPAAGKSFTVDVEPTSDTYNGNPHEPRVTVTDDKGTTVAPTVTDGNGTTVNYTVAYTTVTEGASLKDGKPLNAGTYTVVVTGKEGTTYEGFAGTATYVILPATITDIVFVDADPDATGPYSVTYNGEEQTPDVTVTSGTLTLDLVKDTDYTLAYNPTPSIDAGEVMVTAVGKGNFTGVVTAKFNIVPATIYITPTATEKTYGEADPETFDYDVTDADGNEVEVALTGNLTRAGGEDVGKYEIYLNTLAETTGNYTLEFAAGAPTQFTINPKSLKELTQQGNIHIVGDNFAEDAFNGDVTTIYNSQFGAMLLELGDDYELSYTPVSSNAKLDENSEPADWGTYTVRVRAVYKDGEPTGNYVDEYEFTLVLEEGEQLLDASLANTSATYSGNDQLEYAGLTVTSEKGELLKNPDHYIYSISKDAVSVKTIVDVGAYTITVNGNNDVYKDSSDTVTFFVYAKDISDSNVKVTVTLEEDDKSYDGTAKTPVPSIEFNGKPLVEDIDYTLSYSNNLNAGTATVTINGKGNFTGSRPETFTIDPATLTVGELGNKEYNGRPQEQKPSVTSGTKTLIENVDYTLTHTGETTDVSDDGVIVTVTAIENGNYTTSDGKPVSKPYAITAREIMPEWLSIVPDTLAYTGSPLDPLVIVHDSEYSMMLKEDFDYELTITPKTTGVTLDNGKPKDVGTYTVTVKGIGNYTGTVSKDFKVLANLSGLTVTVDPESATYDGTSKTPTLTVKSGNNDLTLGATNGYTATYSHNGVDMGEFTASTEFIDTGVYVINVTGTGSYDGSIGAAVFTIKPGRFEVADILVEFTEEIGKAHTPEPNVTDENAGTALVKNTHYTVSYANNAAAGTATATFTGIGNYAGCVVHKTFTINSGKIFSVTYDGNGSTGGTVPTDNELYSRGATVYVKGGVPTKSGVVFIGWVPDTQPTKVVTSLAEENEFTTIYSAGAEFIIDADTTLYALWAVDDNNTGKPDYAENYTVTASASEGGSIDPSGTKTYELNDTVTFTIKNGSGKFSSLTVDGTAVTPTSTASGEYTYTLTVTGDHVVIASFTITNTIPGGGGGGGGGGTPDTDPDPTDPPDGGGSTTPGLIRDKHFAYVQGRNNGFEPNATMTRAEVATILVRLMTGEMEIPTGHTTSFPDVDPEMWYHDAIAYLEQFGIINGYLDGTFRPTAPITRAEFATMMMRFYEVEDWTGEPIFSDLPETHWAYDYINSAHAYGFVLGYTDGTFAPDQYIRRAEAVALINRVLERVADKEFIDEHIASLVTYPDVDPTHWAYYDIIEASNGHDFTYDFGDEDWLGIWPGNVDPNASKSTDTDEPAADGTTSD